jgi:transposase
MEENDIQAIFNVPYSPEYNPIEKYFGHIKRPYKQMKLGKMINGEKFDSKKLIIEAIDSRSQESVMRVAMAGLEKLK